MPRKRKAKSDSVVVSFDREMAVAAEILGVAPEELYVSVKRDISLRPIRHVAFWLVLGSVLERGVSVRAFLSNNDFGFKNFSVASKYRGQMYTADELPTRSKARKLWNEYQRRLDGRSKATAAIGFAEANRIYKEIQRDG